MVTIDCYAFASNAVKFKPKFKLQNSQCAFLKIFGIAVTLTFDLLTSKCNQVM